MTDPARLLDESVPGLRVAEGGLDVAAVEAEYAADCWHCRTWRFASGRGAVVARLLRVQQHLGVTVLAVVESLISIRRLVQG